jgi:hypothetical protein
MDPKILRRLVLFVFVGGIAGMIVGSIADNNGIAITFGLVTAVAAICLMLVTSVTARDQAVVFDERRAEEMESRIQVLVADGADETGLRALVRDAVLLGRSARAVSPSPRADHQADASATGSGEGPDNGSAAHTARDDQPAS